MVPIRVLSTSQLEMLILLLGIIIIKNNYKC